MIQGQIHQLLHAYRSGHGQIAGSVRLGDRDSDLVTRLSDLSGSLSSGVRFDSYLTVYRLPSRKFFALARTWPDSDAPRAGCVVTHTILVPLESWSSLPDVRSIDRLFRNPRSTPENDFSLPLDLSWGESSLRPIPTEPDPLASQAFVSRYLGQGLRPIVWFDAAEPEEYLWRLLGHLWPKLRAAFSCCTFSLQERTLEDRPFDLLFAPSPMYARFAKLSSDHLIEAQMDGAATALEPWCEYWAKALFSSQPGLPLKESELPVWRELDEDPTAVRKLSLVQELRLRAAQSPTAGVGAIDVVESLAPEAASALVLKRNVLADAIEAASAAHSGEEALTSLRLIEDRLRRESFRGVAADFEKRVTSAAAAVTAKEPDAALQVSGTWLTDSLSGSKNAFVEGVMMGLRELANTNPSRLSVLRSYPEVAAELFRVVPTFGATYLQVGGESARATLIDWLGSTRDLEALRIVRMSVLPSVGPKDGDLLSALLRDLRSDEVEESLNILLTLDDGLANKAIRSVVGDRISSVYPIVVRQWAAALSDWRSGIAETVASTFGLNRHGFVSLLDEKRFDGARQAKVLAGMVCEQLSSACPYWFRELASEDARLIKLLIAESVKAPDGTEAALSKLLTAVPDVPVAESGELAAVFKFDGRPVFSQLLDATMRGLIASYISEGGRATEMRTFVEHSATKRWFQAVPSAQLTSLFVRGSSSGPSAVARAAEWISEAPTTLFQRRPSVLLDLADTLLSYMRRSFPQGVEMSLVKLLKRSQSEAPSEVRQALASKMLRFSLDNVRFPVGALVAEAFADVYAVAVQKSRPPSFFVALFTSYDWDKAKDLRVSLVDAFLRSNWSPGDLAIAASNAGILRKIFKRLHRRSNGAEYARAMLQDLTRRTDSSTTQVKEQLKALLADPDFYEEWD